jgi:hypothetical protein
VMGLGVVGVLVEMATSRKLAMWVKGDDIAACNTVVLVEYPIWV